MWKLTALFEILVALFIAVEVVEDWVKKPKYGWATWNAFLGAEIEGPEDLERVRAFLRGEGWERP